MRRLIRFVALLLICCTHSAYGVVIDDFEVGPFTTRVEHGEVGLDSSHVLGGARSYTTYDSLNSHTISLAHVDGMDNGIVFTAYALFSSDGYYQSTSPLDITAARHDAFIATVGSAPASGFDISLLAITGPNQRGVLTVPITGAGTYAFPYSSFAVYGDQQGADWKSISNVLIYVSTQSSPVAGTILQLNDLRTGNVPEPSCSLAVTSLVLSCLARRSRGNDGGL
ncbi:MAG TPA: hypothetical protein VF669_03855 [Tepidisphaeraceae bacterium]